MIKNFNCSRRLNSLYKQLLSSQKGMSYMANRKNITFLNQTTAAAIDAELFSDYAFKVEQLMELAGLASAKAVQEQYPKGKVLVLCGPGNNGGDGFVCARHLKQFGFEPSIVYPKESKNELMDALKKQCVALDIPVEHSLPAENNLSAYSLIVDALFGFSFRPPLRPPFDQIITRVTESGINVFSIDIPSGWDVDSSGPPLDGIFIKPHSLISLTAPKLCVRNFTGPHYLGGRFIPPKMAEKYKMSLPEYQNADQIVRLD